MKERRVPDFFRVGSTAACAVTVTSPVQGSGIVLCRAVKYFSLNLHGLGSGYCELEGRGSLRSAAARTSPAAVYLDVEFLRMGTCSCIPFGTPLSMMTEFL